MYGAYGMPNALYFNASINDFIGRCQLVGEHDESPALNFGRTRARGLMKDTHNGYAQGTDSWREQPEQHSRQQIDLKYMPSSNHNRQRDTRHR